MIQLLLITGLSMTASMSEAVKHEGGLLFVEVSKIHKTTLARCEQTWDKATRLCKPNQMIPMNDECRELTKKQIQKRKKLNFEYICLLGDI